MADAFVRVATLDDVPPGKVLGVVAAGRRICLANVDGTVYAVQDNCTHKDFPLSAGMLDVEEASIECAWHGARFDLATGRALALPAFRPVKTYEVKVEDGEIYVAIDQPG